MPKFKSKNIRGKWAEDAMKAAVSSILTNRKTLRQATVIFGVPKSSLGDRLKKLKREEEITMKPDMGRFRQTFSQQSWFDLDRMEFLKLAFNLAEAMKISHRFSTASKSAGKDFYYGFMKRHPELSLRTAESTSMQRAVGFNKSQVSRFFEQLKTMLDKFNFHPSKIFNADETGVSIVHANDAKVISVKSKKQVGKLTSGERGRNITIMLCINALGDHFIPPLFIFPRKRLNTRLMINAPEGSHGAVQDNGWINGPIYLRWLQEFIKRVRPTEKEHAQLKKNLLY
ncbi:uncharacterized protein LOC125501081 [Athalia rosae]|uniref:uncharacterized protein LOC125501081 n=1 Tax=Athalia rosae TaxID=37344 RepID=UPI002033BD1C|nr:uncharacterized protein LOC125501081 [Athalia rosae]